MDGPAPPYFSSPNSDDTSTDDAENGHCASAMDSTTSKLRRRLVSALVLVIGLGTTGVLYLVLAPRPQIAAAEAAAQADPALIAQGERLYNNACSTCHGMNLQGVTDRGSSLIGVGAAAVYFQVSTGRMPLARQETQGVRKAPVPELDPDTTQGRLNLQALSAYVQAHGGVQNCPRSAARS